jgi:hypothetical protein
LAKDFIGLIFRYFLEINSAYYYQVMSFALKTFTYVVPYIWKYIQSNYIMLSSLKLGATCMEVYQNNIRDISPNILAGDGIWKCQKDKIPNLYLLIELPFISNVSKIEILSNQWVKFYFYSNLQGTTKIVNRIFN